MKQLVTRPICCLLSTLVGIGALVSCQRKASIKMAAIGDTHAAENRKPPVVVAVSSTDPDGKYVTGAGITITVTFSKPVHVGGAGQIALALATGAAERSASYESGSDSDTLELLYQVQTGDQSADLQYASVDALSCAADTTIRDSFDNDAVLTLPELSSALSLGGQKHLIINPAPTSTTYEDLGVHFEKSVYQTRSIKRLLIKESEVTGLARATVLVNSNPFVCSVDSAYDSVLALAGLEPVMSVDLDAALMKAVYGTPQTVTLALDGVGIAPNETTDQVTLKDFNMFEMGSASFDNGTQLKDGFQGWMGPVMGVFEGSDGGAVMISGYFDAINH